MKSEFKRFQKTFTAYQKEFGLNGYKTYFKNESLAGVFADIYVDQDGMVATVRLNAELPDKDKPFASAHDNAKHEAIHLLVGRLSDYAQSRYVTKCDVAEAEEELVRRLEQLIPDIKGIK
jgi:hypothetical protein